MPRSQQLGAGDEALPRYCREWRGLVRGESVWFVGSLLGWVVVDQAYCQELVATFEKSALSVLNRKHVPDSMPMSFPDQWP